MRLIPFFTYHPNMPNYRVTTSMIVCVTSGETGGALQTGCGLNLNYNSHKAFS